MKLSKLTLLLFAGLCGFLCVSITQAQSTYDPFTQDEQKIEERPIELPKAPLPENWLIFPTTPTATQKFFIDSASLSIDNDKVIHYTLISKSRSGAINISFEGIRCATHEKRQYAIGRSDGTWSLSHRDQWDPVINKKLNPAHLVLIQDYLCVDHINFGSVEKIIQKLLITRPKQDK